MNPLFLFLPLTLGADPGAADLRVHTTFVGEQAIVYASLSGAEGDGFLVVAETTGGAAAPLGGAPLSPLGRGTAYFSVPADELPALAGVKLRAVHAASGGVTTSPAIPVPVPDPVPGMPDLQNLDFDWTFGPDEPQAGQVIDDEWSELGMSVVAQNNNPSHPDLAIIFDSSNPTGGDFDLATPGPGVGNDAALGNLLVVAENADGLADDGLVDVPDDEAWGGTIRFTFAAPWEIGLITVVDIDDAMPSFVRVFQVGEPLPTEIPIPNLGDNSVQSVFIGLEGVFQMDVVFGGSGGLANIFAIPCPLLVNFDETTFGIPLDLQPGQIITTDFLDFGLTIGAENNNPTHPDLAILYDTSDPGGADPDLTTPGPGIGNDKALGNVLIIAENDVDSEPDGLIDVPDDEAAGGILSFEWDVDVLFVGATILDVDGSRLDAFNLYDEFDNLIATIPILPLGDNSVQTLTIEPAIPGVRRAELLLDGSGAVTRLRFCPEDVTKPDDDPE